MRNLAEVPNNLRRGTCIHRVVDFHREGYRRGVYLEQTVTDRSRIEDSEELVLLGRGRIHLHLVWPGYPIKSHFEEINFVDMTRGRLARQVCKKTTQFIQRCATMPISSSHERWRIGPGAFWTHNILLVSIVDVGEGVWAAQLGYVTEQ